MSREERIEYLESERIKIWEKITVLEELLKEKTSDFEIDAKQSSEQALVFKNTSEELKDTIEGNLLLANSKLDTIKIHYNEFENYYNVIKEFSENSKVNSESIQSINDIIQSKYTFIINQIAEIEKIFETKPIIDEKLIKLEGVFTKADDFDSKITQLYKSIGDRKKEIDSLYFEIVGYTDIDETGVKTEVDGLKKELENSYLQIKGKLEDLNTELLNLKNNTISKYEKFIAEKEVNFTLNFEEWKNNYTLIFKKIEGLLPNALTAGLSFAYSEKKLSEEIENNKFDTTFKWAIFGLICVSLIPFGISIKSLIDHTDIEQVILRIPRLVIAILPLYIPVLWVAYSANRKMNLSKRLREEYSHKEVLSKTFEGLSRQINDIEDKDISSDLRIKLLYNILEVSAENPGKLISDYNKSDHPLMDALDKSIKLTNAITKLSNIPGFNKLASTLQNKSEKILKEQGEKADAGIESIE